MPFNWFEETKFYDVIFGTYFRNYFLVYEKFIETVFFFSLNFKLRKKKCSVVVETLSMYHSQRNI